MNGSEEPAARWGLSHLPVRRAFNLGPASLPVVLQPTSPSAGHVDYRQAHFFSPIPFFWISAWLSQRTDLTAFKRVPAQFPPSFPGEGNEAAWKGASGETLAAKVAPDLQRRGGRGT